MIPETPNKFCVDIAKTGKAKCRHCNKQIDKNRLRIGKYIAFNGKTITYFYHPSCAFALFGKARRSENVVQDLLMVSRVLLMQIGSSWLQPPKKVTGKGK